jgi:hypothetical protein
MPPGWGRRDTFRVDGKDVRAADASVLRDLRTGGADALTEAQRIANSR